MNPFIRCYNWVRYLVTDEKNRWDIGIFYWMAGCTEFLYRSGTATTWDPSAFGMGLAGCLGAGAALAWARAVRDKTDGANN